MYLASPCRGPITVPFRPNLLTAAPRLNQGAIRFQPAAPGSIRASALGAGFHLSRLSGPRSKPTIPLLCL